VPVLCQNALCPVLQCLAGARGVLLLFIIDRN